MMTSKLLAASLLVSANLVGCIDGDVLDFGSDDAEVIDESLGQTEQALGSCTYRMQGAAITKQITSIGEPTQLLVELVTLTDRPYKMSATSWTFPTGLRNISLGTTSCVESGTTQWRCRHQGVVEQTTATSGTGAYAMNFMPTADAGSGCGNGTTQTIHFSLTTESWATYEVATQGPEALLYPAWQYGGTPFGIEVPEGQTMAYAQFINGNSAVNDIASSIKVKPGYSVTLYETAWFSGRSVTFTADHPWIGDGSLNFNDIASSVVVRKL